MKLRQLLTTILFIHSAAGVTAMFVSAAHASNGLSYGVEQSLVATPVWEQANSSGFGEPQTSEVTALAAFGDSLYAGTYHPTDPLQTIDGAQIFRSSDGINWTAVTDPGFGNSHDTAPPAILDLTVFNGYLYASTGRGNAAQIWRSSTGNEFRSGAASPATAHSATGRRS